MVILAHIREQHRLSLRAHRDDQQLPWIRFQIVPGPVQ
jgi:hypothetical protein